MSEGAEPKRLSRVRGIVAETASDFRTSWRGLAIADLAYKALAFAVLTPAAVLFLRWLLRRTGSRVVADADIARFFVTTPEGIVALVLGGAILGAITALEIGCLMAVGFVTARGSSLDAKRALWFAATRAASILRLTLHMVVRVIAGLIPFVAALGLVYVALLRGHDINYFLSRRPPAFQVAVLLAGVIVAALVALLVRTALRWSLALPLVLFEKVHPRHALRESARRAVGNRAVIAAVLSGWAVAALLLAAVTSALVNGIVRVAAPLFAGSASALIAFLTVAILLSGLLGLAVAIINVSLFSLAIVRLWLHAGARAATVSLPTLSTGDPTGSGVPRRLAVALGAVAVLLAVAIALAAFVVTRRNEPVLVIAHRGASLEAPENTLAAFRLAVAQGADFVELDVQESLDGEVVVFHDSDLMKVGGSPMKIWEHTAAELRGVDIGSFRDPRFKDERMPTLAEALAVCKGKSRVLVELKSYGHGRQLEERVARVVEAAGMENHCTFMSLDHDMVRRMKELRPSWRVGALVAKALGDPTTLGADFLAVEVRMATPRFVRRAHRAGSDVYVWTVNDPTWMFTVLSRGVDGVITDKPALAREVLDRRAKLSDAERLLVPLLLRAGVRVEALEAEHALRP